MKIAWVLMNLRFFLDPWGQNSITLVFTCISIVMNMHKRVILFLIFVVFTLNDLKQKIKMKETQLLLRQRFNNKIGYTL